MYKCCVQLEDSSCYTWCNLYATGWNTLAWNTLAWNTLAWNKNILNNQLQVMTNTICLKSLCSTDNIFSTCKKGQELNIHVFLEFVWFKVGSLFHSQTPTTPSPTFFNVSFTRYLTQQGDKVDCKLDSYL
jgi:hypothetical protein